MKQITAGVLLAMTSLGADVFDGGTKNIALTVGSGSGFNTTYTIVGVSLSYFALNGLSLGVGYRGWFGGTPSINEIDTGVTYYIPVNAKVRPYVGGVYRHTYISSGYSDYDTVGARAGISYVEGSGYIAAGWIQEWYSNDNGDDYSRGYPEISAGISF